MKNRNLFTLFVCLFLISCHNLKGPVQKSISNEKLYQSSIEDAMSPAPSKVSKDLISINPKNTDLIWKTIDQEEYLLVATWSRHPNYYEPYLDSAFYPTGGYEVWVTTAPELLTLFGNEKVLDTNLRLQQLLGLPPNPEVTYTHFIQFWAKPTSLFRPCPDNEVSDKQCDLCFPPKTDSTYKTWINGNRVSRYYECDLYKKYPWTQLGYTYDWNPTNITHIGLSEFVIKTNQQIVVEGVYTTSEYLNKGN